MKAIDLVWIVAGVILGVVVVVLGRRWATWVGLVAGLVPALFWGLFALGYGIGPGR